VDTGRLQTRSLDRTPIARSKIGLRVGPPFFSGRFGQVPLTSKRKLHLSKIVINSGLCNLFTEIAKATGLENIGHDRTLPGLLTPGPVPGSTRITPENNGKIRPQSDGENAFAGASGGGGGIRTHEGVPPLLS
jgi:hypothetical protein